MQYEVVRVFQEQASGINEHRKQLQHLLIMAEHREFQRLLIEYPDRLARFGYYYLERYLNSHGVTIESTQVHEPKTSSEELTDAYYGLFGQTVRQTFTRVSSENKKTDDRDERR